MFNFQFNSHQFQRTSHFLRQLGKPQVWGFFEKTATIFSLLKCDCYFCPFTPMSLSFFLLPLLPHLLPEWWWLCVRAGLSFVSAPIAICRKCVCSQLEFLHPATSPSTSSEMPSPLPCLHSWCECDLLYSTVIPNWDSMEASTVDLPLTHSPILLQSMLYKWFLSLYFSYLSLCHKTGGSLVSSPLALFHFLNQSSVTFGHIWFESQIHKLIFAWFSNSNCVQVIPVFP